MHLACLSLAVEPSDCGMPQMLVGRQLSKHAVFAASRVDRAFLHTSSASPEAFNSNVQLGCSMRALWRPGSPPKPAMSRSAPAGACSGESKVLPSAQ